MQGTNLPTLVVGTATYSRPALPLNAPLNHPDAARLIAHGRQVARNHNRRDDILRAATALEDAYRDGPVHTLVNSMTDEQLNRWTA